MLICILVEILLVYTSKSSQICLLIYMVSYMIWSVELYIVQELGLETDDKTALSGVVSCITFPYLTLFIWNSNTFFLVLHFLVLLFWYLLIHVYRNTILGFNSLWQPPVKLWIFFWRLGSLLSFKQKSSERGSIQRGRESHLMFCKS